MQMQANTRKCKAKCIASKIILTCRLQRLLVHLLLARSIQLQKPSDVDFTTQRLFPRSAQISIVCAVEGIDRRRHNPKP